MNGLDPDGAAARRHRPQAPDGRRRRPRVPPQPAPAVEHVPAANPEPTPARVSAADIAAVAARNGVPSSLASAIAWQESGFNNAMVSSPTPAASCRSCPGPGTRSRPTSPPARSTPHSAADNVGAGVLYLGQLLRQTGGDPALAAAGYYQGLASVRRIGMLPETRRYVDNVLALRGRFGG